MTETFALVLAVLPGAAVTLVAHRRWPWVPLLPMIVLGSALVAVGYLGLLSMVGVPWSPWAVAVPSLAAAVVLAAGSRELWAARRRPRLDLWSLVALMGSGLHAWLVASVPAWGWDFRYIWGLKARAFSGFGSFSMAWLAWPGEGFAHPEYPPMWPAMLSFGVVVGGDVAATAALWQGVLVAATAATGWALTAKAPRPIRCLAALAGAWTPVLSAGTRSGYADLLLAFLVALAFLGLTRVEAGGGGRWLLLGVVVGLGLAKQEGVAWAVAVVVAVGWRAWRRGLVALTGLLPWIVWAVILRAHGVHGVGWLAPRQVLDRLGELPEAVRAAVRPEVALPLLLLAGALVLAALARQWTALIIVGTWAAGVAMAYLVGATPFAWRVANSLDRLAAQPLPALVAVALAAHFPGTRRPGGSRA